MFHISERSKSRLSFEKANTDTKAINITLYSFNISCVTIQTYVKQQRIV